eukprot:COSAG02_NODE_3317_length_6950_cov_2.669683_9_plen_266_part_00
MLSNYRALLDVFAHIDVRAAKAGPEDTALIMGALERLPKGANGLNCLAMGQMTAWAKDKARSMVATRRGPDGLLVRAERELREVNELALMLTYTDERAEARRLYEEVIEGQAAQLGGSHTSTLTTKGNLAILLKNMGETAEARRLYEEVIEGQTAQLGGSHTGTLTTKCNLAGLLRRMGETAEARRLYEEVIEGQTAQLGGSHTSTLQTRVNFAVFLFNSGDSTASKLALDELHDISTKHHGTEHPMTQHIAGLVDQIGSMLARD